MTHLKNGFIVWLGLTCTALAVRAAPAVLSQEAQTCLECHGEADFETQRDGKPHSLHVDPKKFAASVHAGTSCTSCHSDLEGVELPHPERLAPVVCGNCHSARQAEFAESLHGKALARGDKLAPDCAGCHGAHDILPVKDPDSHVAPIRIPFVCGGCHEEGAPVSQKRNIHQHNIVKNFSLSIHGEGLFAKGLSVSATCASCHTSHHILPHTDPRSSIARANIAKTCSQCHSQIATVHRKVIKGELWQSNPAAIPACVDCHQPHKARKVFYDQGMADRDCLSCHAKPDIKRTADGRSLHIAADKFAGSAHAKIACAQCHTGGTPAKKRPCATMPPKVDCAVCHTSQVEQYRKSTHGQLHAKNDPNAPYCTDCHGTHRIQPRKEHASAIFPINVPDLCAKCHRSGQQAAKRDHSTQKDISKNYMESIHGKGLLKSGLVVTAMCTSCHTPHGELPAADPASTVNKENIAQTCSQCHRGVYEKYSGSVHSPPANKTDKEQPVCSTCHTAHTIKRTDATNFKLEIMGTCGKCHEDVTKTYFDTYHGKVSKLGYGKTAKCHDCHGAHGIYPVDDTRSQLSRNNIIGTCKKCHPGATRKFAGYLTHSTHHDPKKYPLIFWTFWAMTTLLVGTFLAFGLHTLLWLPRSLQMRREHPHVKYDPKAKQVLRFPPLHNIQHVVMILSFMTLTATGMSLKFSYTAWAVFLAHFLGGFETCGYIHRAAAVAMFLLFGSHLVDLFRRLRQDAGGWKGFLLGSYTMIPTLKDAYEVIATLKWYLGLGGRPNYGRWTYWEKFDYFAVFWGITIIGSTGLTLWFPEFITRFLPGWIINVATIIHSDEALLASGFIFTIHFFNTHFRPEKFPMDIVVFTGRMPLEEFKRERPEEYAALQESGELEKYLVKPLPEWAIDIIRTFAWAALACGILLIVGIIYAMVFAYR